MDTQTVICTNCGHEIQLNEALTRRIREGLISEMRPEFEKQKNDLDQRREELERMEQGIQEAVNRGVDAGLQLARTTAIEEARALVSAEQLEISAKIASQDAALKEKDEIELQLRRDRVDLQRKVDEQELLRQRAVDAEVAEARRDLEQKAKLKEGEYAAREEGYKKKVEELNKQLQQRSMQTQGEALEIDLLQTLRTTFPSDQIERVGKGERGADCVHHVFSPSGMDVGVILWESKNTKNFSDGWIQKLKDDVIEAKADMGFILTIAMPKEITTFGALNGIWVTSFSCFKPFATLMRSLLIRVASERSIQVGKQTKAELLYDFVTGPEFRQRVDAVAEPFVEMQMLHEKEKRSMNQIWSAREKQLQRVLDSISGLAGSIEGLTGKTLEIASFAQKALPEAS